MPESVITYRQASESDLAQICALGLEVNNLHHTARPDVYAGDTTDPLRDQLHWLTRIAGEQHCTFLAERDGTAIGFITIRMEQQAGSLLQPLCYGRVGTVGVAGASRGQGVGRKLMQLAETWAVAQGALDLRLTVWAFNTDAMRLYQELGYEVRAVEMGKPCKAHETKEQAC